MVDRLKGKNRSIASFQNSPSQTLDRKGIMIRTFVDTSLPKPSKYTCVCTCAHTLNMCAGDISVEVRG